MTPDALDSLAAAVLRRGLSTGEGHAVGADTRSYRLADHIEHTFLRPESVGADIDRLCEEAVACDFAAVCVHGLWADRCVARVRHSPVRVVAVAAFPHGAAPTAAKVAETTVLVEAGVDEIDVVASLGHIAVEEWSYVEDDIAAVVAAAGAVAVKVILETALWPPVTVVKAAAIAREAGAAFVKTSTGFHGAGGATVEAVALLRAAVGSACGVKAAGGIRDCVSAVRMLAAGADRLGSSAGVALAQCSPDPVGGTSRDWYVEHAAACTAGGSW